MVKNKIKILKVRASWPMCYENQIEFKAAVSLIYTFKRVL